MLILRQFAIGKGDIISQIYSLLRISDPGAYETVLFLAGHPLDSHEKAVSN